MLPGTLQAVAAVCTVLSAIGALVAAAVCLKISEQVSQLETRIVLRLADQYVTKEELRLVLDKPPQLPQRKAAHA